jgi:hypothetical protein
VGRMMNREIEPALRSSGSIMSFVTRMGSASCET